MKKVLLGILLCCLFMATPVSAANPSSNDLDSNKNENVVSASEKRVTIRTQAQELKQLRSDLKAKVKEKKLLIEQYRNLEKLTDEQREQVKALIKSMKIVQEKLGSIYQNAVSNIQKYKKDTSTNKLTGLDLVITSQQERINLLKEAIAELEK